MARNNPKRSQNNVNVTKVRTMVRSMLSSQLENKAFISSISAAATSTSGGVLELSNNIVQGDDFGNRTGNEITPISHAIRLTSTATTNSQVTRFVIFQDTMNRAAAPAVTDVLHTADYMSPYNRLLVKQQKRFRILYDRFFNLCVNGQNIHTCLVSLPKIPKIYFNGVGGSSASAGKNSIYILVIASATSGEYDYAWNIEYHDG
jgi:hypothetical protein